jgi:hypothetical protein
MSARVAPETDMCASNRAKTEWGAQHLRNNVI